MRAILAGLGSGPEVWAMHIERVPETDTIERQLELVQRSIQLVETSRNSEYRTAALRRLRHRLAQLQAL